MIFRQLRFSIGDLECLLPLRGLVTVTQVSTVGQVKTHQSLMGSHDSLVNLEVCRATTQALDVDAPFLGVEVEGLESTRLASQLNGIDVLVATVVSGAWVTLGVFVGHGRPQSIEDGARGNILGCDEDDGFALTLDLEFLEGRC